MLINCDSNSCDKSNERLKEISDIVDILLPNNDINIILKKYETDLQDFDYIDTVEKFSILSLKGTMRYINKIDKKLRTGGLLVKIFMKDKKWYAKIKQYDKFYDISYNSNYIFYLNNKSNLIRQWADLFVTELDKNSYEV
jgi:cyclopropane fatty-acyl-phospholipid synthase-like methyltransferase